MVTVAITHTVTFLVKVPTQNCSKQYALVLQNCAHEVLEVHSKFTFFIFIPFGLSGTCRNLIHRSATNMYLHENTAMKFENATATVGTNCTYILLRMA